MELLIDIWFKILYLVYWIGWIGSMLIWNVSILTGIGIGVLCFVVGIIILQILYFINKDGWIWNV